VRTGQVMSRQCRVRSCKAKSGQDNTMSAQVMSGQEQVKVMIRSCQDISCQVRLW